MNKIEERKKRREESKNRKAIQRMDYANELYDSLVKAKKAFVIIWMQRARVLKEIKDSRLYKYMHGEGFATWEEFCADPAVGVSRVTADLYISLYEYYVERLQMSEDELNEIPLGRLQRMLPHMDKMDTDEKAVVLAEARLLSDRDFYKSLGERTNTLPTKRPMIYYDSIHEGWVIKFMPNAVYKIVDESEDKIIWQNT